MGALRGGPQMSEAAWVWSIVLIYVSVGAAAVVVGMAIRLRGWPAVGVCLTGLAVAAWWIQSTGPQAIIPACFGGLAVLGAVYIFALLPHMGWREQKERKELTRQAALH